MGIVTNGLVGYWHFQQGVSGATWSNIAPATVGSYNGTISGVTLQTDGMRFDGVDDKVTIPFSANPASFTIEVCFSYNTTTSSYPIYTNTDVNVRSFSNFIYVGDSYRQSQFGGNVANTDIYLSTTLTPTTLNIYKSGAIFTTKAGETLSKFGTSFVLGATPYNNGWLNGTIKYCRIYNRVLSDAEISQNFAVGSAIWEGAPPSTPPVVSIVSTSRTKISDETGMDRSNITFKFDKDVTAWEVRVLGAGQGTGTLAASGGNVSANTNIVAEVDWTELYQEGSNKVNIYGQGSGGWTPYEA